MLTPTLVDVNTLFRGNSMASKGIDVYMKLVGFPYLQETLSAHIKNILTENNPCEVDPMRLNKGDDLEKNWKNLEAYVTSTIDIVLASASKCPQCVCFLASPFFAFSADTAL